MGSSATVSIGGGGPAGTNLVIMGSPGGRVVAHVAPAAGGELSSLAVEPYGELLYRADDFAPPPPGEWRGRAPLLWPAVGRNFTPAALRAATPQCCFERDGVVYDLPIHGFARDRAWNIVDVFADQETAGVRLTLRDDEASRRVYPWPFELSSVWRVHERGVSQTVEVRSSATIPFGIGNHLTVRVPTDRFDATRVACSATVRLELDDHSLLNGEETPIDLAAGEPLTTPWLLNGVFGRIVGDPVMTVSCPGGPVVTVKQEVDRGAPHVAAEDRLFVVYGNRERGYYCPEPWIGRPNGLQTGQGVVVLPAGEVFSWTMSVEVE